MSVRFKECSFPTFEEAKAANKITIVPDDGEPFDVDGDLKAAEKAEDPDQFILEICVPAIDAYRGGWVVPEEAFVEETTGEEEPVYEDENFVDETVTNEE
jgi:hypothetical protein